LVGSGIDPRGRDVDEILEATAPFFTAGWSFCRPMLLLNRQNSACSFHSKTKMKKHRVPQRVVFLASIAVVMVAAPRLLAAEEPASTSVSPDKKWEYTCEEYAKGQCSPELVNIATKDIVVDLSDLPSGRDAAEARAVWAPDSQRFGFNHSPPHAHHTTYKTIAIYQLRDDKWVPLKLPVDENSQRSQLLQLTRRYSPKSARDLSKASPTSDTLTVRKWTDANTAILYASDYTVAALFTLKFDGKGQSKIVAMHRLSKAEMEQESGEE
jgi:hypothetical protein